MSKRFRNRAWDRAADTCRPQSGQTISGGVYVSLAIPAGVKNVRLDGVVILADATVFGTNITGTIIIPRSNLPNIRPGSSLRVLRRTWHQICNRIGA